jgi:hypothetical protein
MTTEPDPALTGAAFELANAGYRPMPEPKEKDEEKAIGSDSASLREAAEPRSGPQQDAIVREYLDASGKRVAPGEAVTLQRAARDYAEAAAADKLSLDNATSKDVAARVDALRAEALATDPDAAEYYGFEPPEGNSDLADPEKADSGKVSSELLEASSERTADELEPEIEEILQHPQIRHAIEQKIGETEKTRQSYLDGLAAATQIAQVSFLSQFPELASIAPENLAGALEQMSRLDPARFARVQAAVANSEQLIAHQQHESRSRAERARQGFLEFAKSEDARFETMLKGESKATQRAVTAEIFSAAKASGIGADELTQLFHSEPVMRNAVFQRMMYDAGKYRLMMKARDAAAAKPVPPVQRPGMARTPAERDRADLRMLNTKLSSSGDIKDAVALYNARKSSRH